MADHKCTCPEDWQGMDHTSGCKARAQLREGNAAAREEVKKRGVKLHPKLANKTQEGER